MARTQLVKVEFSKVSVSPSLLQKILEESCEDSLKAGFSLSFQSERLTAARILQTARFDGSRFVMFTPNQFCALYRACARVVIKVATPLEFRCYCCYRFCTYYLDDFVKICPWQTKYYQPFKQINK